MATDLRRFPSTLALAPSVCGLLSLLMFGDVTIGPRPTYFLALVAGLALIGCPGLYATHAMNVAVGMLPLLVLVLPEQNRVASVFTEPLLDPLECNEIIRKSEDRAAQRSLDATATAQARDGWLTKRHLEYPTTDQEVGDIPALAHLREELAEKRLFPLLERHFRVPSSSMEILDMFVVKYDEHGQKKLRPHRDKGALTFNIALSPMSNYTGGGMRLTYWGTKLNVVQGHVIVHPGQLLHEGVKLSKGTRYIIVGHVKVDARPSGMRLPPMWGYGASCTQHHAYGVPASWSCSPGWIVEEIVTNQESNVMFLVAAILFLQYASLKQKKDD